MTFRDELKTLGTYELLARVVSPCGRVREALRELLKTRGGSLRALANCTDDELLAGKGLDPREVARLRLFFELARRFGETTWPEHPTITGPVDVSNRFAERLASEPVEHFYVLALDSRSNVISETLVSKGTTATTITHPREVFAPAVAAHAAAIVLVHNHPSGDPTPSDADIEQTKKLCRAGMALAIVVVDHVIIGQGRYATLTQVCLDEQGIELPPPAKKHAAAGLKKKRA